MANNRSSLENNSNLANNSGNNSGNNSESNSSNKTENNISRTGKQNEKRDLLISLLGELPQQPRDFVEARLVETEEFETFILEKLTLDLNGIESVPAFFVKPKSMEGKLPVIVFNHSHGGFYHNGKNELINGVEYLRKPSYAEALAKEGYAVLCIDAWCFGERRGRTESQIFKNMLWQGRVLFGMMAYDSMRAVDYLFTREDVDNSRIGTMGISMGGLMSWWLSALDTRVKVCIDLCSLTDFHALIEQNGLDYHGIYYYVPSLLKHFTTAGINELIAPRPHLSLSGKYDPLVPYTGSVKIDKELKEIYKSFAAEEAWQMITYPCGHLETVEMRQEVLAFLRKWM